jgi:hypothetical protein
MQQTIPQTESAPSDQRPPSSLLTCAEAIAYLRLDAKSGDADERLRNLIRRHGLPVIRVAGGLQLFRLAAIDSWLESKQRQRVGHRTLHPARLRAVKQQQQRLTSNRLNEQSAGSTRRQQMATQGVLDPIGPPPPSRR